MLRRDKAARMYAEGWSCGLRLFRYGQLTGCMTSVMKAGAAVERLLAERR